MTKPGEGLERPKVERFTAVPVLPPTPKLGWPECVLASEYDAQAAELKDRDEHIRHSYAALGDVNQSVYLFDRIRALKLRAETAESSNASLVERVGKLERSLSLAMELLPEHNPQHPDMLAFDECPKGHPDCCGYCESIHDIRAALAPAEEKKV